MLNALSYFNHELGLPQKPRRRKCHERDSHSTAPFAGHIRQTALRRNRQEDSGDPDPCTSTWAQKPPPSGANPTHRMKASNSHGRNNRPHRNRTEFCIDPIPASTESGLHRHALHPCHGKCKSRHPIWTTRNRQTEAKIPYLPVTHVHIGNPMTWQTPPPGTQKRTRRQIGRTRQAASGPRSLSTPDPRAGRQCPSSSCS